MTDPVTEREQLLQELSDKIEKLIQKMDELRSADRKILQPSHSEPVTIPDAKP